LRRGGASSDDRYAWTGEAEGRPDPPKTGRGRLERAAAASRREALPVVVVRIVHRRAITHPAAVARRRLASLTRRPGGIGRTHGNRQAATEVPEVAAEAYCVKCKTKREIKDAVQITMKNGRPATEGKCPVCGTKMFKIGAAG
jgi:hypothetical protein